MLLCFFFSFWINTAKSPLQEKVIIILHQFVQCSHFQNPHNNIKTLIYSQDILAELIIKNTVFHKRHTLNARRSHIKVFHHRICATEKYIESECFKQQEVKLSHERRRIIDFSWTGWSALIALCASIKATAFNTHTKHALIQQTHSEARFRSGRRHGVGAS